jgi:hypothetical protein
MLAAMHMMPWTSTLADTPDAELLGKSDQARVSPCMWNQVAHTTQPLHFLGHILSRQVGCALPCGSSVSSHSYKTVALAPVQYEAHTMFNTGLNMWPQRRQGSGTSRSTWVQNMLPFIITEDQRLVAVQTHEPNQAQAGWHLGTLVDI